MRKLNGDLDSKLSDLSVIIVTHVFATGQAQELLRFLKDKVRRLAFVGHSFPHVKGRSYAELYEKGRLTRRIETPPFSTRFRLLGYLNDLLTTFYFAFRIKKKFDIYYGANSLNALAGILLKKIGFTKIVIFNTVDYVPYRFGNKILNGIYHFLDKLGCYYSDFLWNLSPAMTEARQRRGILKEKSAPQMIVPIGCNFERINRPPFEAINRFDIVYMGHLREYQGIELIIEAMPKILEEVPQARLLIVGTGSLETRLKDMVKELNLEKHVHFTGYVKEHSELEKVLTECAVGLAPYVPDPKSYTWYADPGKPKQYMGCGLPVIMTRVPWIASEIERRRMGMTIDYDKSELANAVVKLLKNDELYMKFRENAISFASEFSWNRIFRDAFVETLKCT